MNIKFSRTANRIANRKNQDMNEILHTVKVFGPLRGDGSVTIEGPRYTVVVEYNRQYGCWFILEARQS